MRRIASKALRAAALTLTCLALATVPTPPQEPSAGYLEHRDGPEGTAVWVPWRVTCTEDMICWDRRN